MRRRLKFLKITFLIVGLLVLANLGHIYQYFLSATFNECFTKWDFQLPAPGEEFYVHSSVHPDAIRVIDRVLRRAFPEYKVVFSNDRRPHLSMKEYYNATDFKENIQVPYLGVS